MTSNIPSEGNNLGNLDPDAEDTTIEPYKETDFYGEQIAKLEKQKLLQWVEETGRHALTLQGIDVSNQLFVEFIR